MHLQLATAQSLPQAAPQATNVLPYLPGLAVLLLLVAVTARFLFR